MIIKIHTDGGSLNNPGQAAIGYLIYFDGIVEIQHGEAIGVASNNVAEYTALLRALEKTKDLIDPSRHPERVKDPVTRIAVFADSELMIKQVNGLYKIKHPDMRDLYMKVKMVENELNLPISYTHVLRERNADADALVKKALGQ